MFLMSNEQFPHGPRTFEDGPLLGAPRSFSDSNVSPIFQANSENGSVTQMNHSSPVVTIVERLKRKRRSVVISDRKVRIVFIDVV